MVTHPINVESTTCLTSDVGEPSGGSEFCDRLPGNVKQEFPALARTGHRNSFGLALVFSAGKPRGNRQAERTQAGSWTKWDGFWYR